MPEAEVTGVPPTTWPQASGRESNLPPKSASFCCSNRKCGMSALPWEDDPEWLRKAQAEEGGDGFPAALCGSALWFL